MFKAGIFTERNQPDRDGKHDSIIFDLDGTLWDPIDTVLQAWNSSLKEHDQSKSELTRTDFEGTMGLQIDEISEQLFPYLNEDVRGQVMTACMQKEQRFLKKMGGTLFPHVEDTLQTLSEDYKLYIVSNCQDGYIESFYEYHQLEKYFLDYENPGRTGLSKGENINLIIERNQLSHPTYIGDTQGDLNASRYAGIPFIYAAYGFGQVDDYDYRLRRFDDLIHIFNKV
ncbi:HAD family hydrolase [Halobacillus litoralis]|uniref:HAD family hydrolase n=1 Tax=Halobacillus litoralis TaxID=45668 RepID=UPI001CFD7CC1|nr:HAD family hydrolase [Halobacillus litoralis]